MSWWQVVILLLHPDSQSAGSKRICFTPLNSCNRLDLGHGHWSTDCTLTLPSLPALLSTLHSDGSPLVVPSVPALSELLDMFPLGFLPLLLLLMPQHLTVLLQRGCPHSTQIILITVPQLRRYVLNGVISGSAGGWVVPGKVAALQDSQREVEESAGEAVLLSCAHVQARIATLHPAN